MSEAPTVSFQNAVARTADGRLWFGTNQGPAIIDPQRPPRSRPISPLDPGPPVPLADKVKVDTQADIGTRMGWWLGGLAVLGVLALGVLALRVLASRGLGRIAASAPGRRSDLRVEEVDNEAHPGPAVSVSEETREGQSADTSTAIEIGEEGAEPEKPRYSLEPAKEREVLAKLEALLSDERVYRDENISLKSLASRLGIPYYLLSQILNTHLGTNFWTLIHGRRVEEAAAQLRDPALAHRKVADIAHDVGFNSIAALRSMSRAWF